jgi:hypothetical protein
LEITRAAAEVVRVEGLASPGPGRAARRADRSEFLRQFMNGDRMQFPDVIR